AGSEHRLAIEYLRAKIAKLIDSLQMAESKTASYQGECQSLRLRATEMARSQNGAERRLADQEHRMETVQEEYRTAVDNYETQLRTMSEHLASLNERLAEQCGQIEMLKHEQQQQQQLQAA